jgi:hypothetical protein
MNGPNDRLKADERRVLRTMGLACVLALVLALAAFVWARNARVGLRTAREEVAAARAEAGRQTEREKERLQLWEEARQDLELMRSNYMYRQEFWSQAVSLDLQRIFEQAGASATDIEYKLNRSDKDGPGRIAVTFAFNGPYAGFKRLLAEIRKHPRLLVIEKLDFSGQREYEGLVKVRFTLAGYYGT